MNCFHALKSSAYRLAFLCCLALLMVGCQLAPPSITESPSSSPSSISVQSPSPTLPAKSEAVKAFEKRLRGELVKKAGITVQSVECPDQVDVETQDPFTCKATAEGKTFNVAINPKTNAKQDKNELRWSTEGLLVLPKLEQTIQQGIQQQFKLDVKASCGGKIRVAKTGETFQCKVTDSRGQSRAVNIRVDDEQGNVTWKL